MDEYLELISVNIWHIIATIGNLLILTYILKKLLFKRVNDVLEKRRNQVDDIYRSAEESASKAEHDRLEYSSKLAGANFEAEEIVKSAVLRADEIGNKIIEEANKKAEQTVRKAESDIALEKKLVMNELKNEISDISVKIAENVVGREISEEDHKELIDSFIDEL